MGLVVFEWYSYGKVLVCELFFWLVLSLNVLWDYVYINVVEEGLDGDLLMFVCNIWIVYEIDCEMGVIIWCLGGKCLNFKVGVGVYFVW